MTIMDKTKALQSIRAFHKASKLSIREFAGLMGGKGETTTCRLLGKAANCRKATVDTARAAGILTPELEPNLAYAESLAADPEARAELRRSRSGRYMDTGFPQELQAYLAVRMTAQGVADMCGCTRQQVMQWAQGTALPAPETARRLFQLGVLSKDIAEYLFDNVYPKQDRYKNRISRGDLYR